MILAVFFQDIEVGQADQGAQKVGGGCQKGKGAFGADGVYKESGKNAESHHIVEGINRQA